jgi:hypothetical protein
VTEGRWEPPVPEASFTYVELHFDDITYNVHGADGTPNPQPVASAERVVEHRS